MSGPQMGGPLDSAGDKTAKMPSLTPQTIPATETAKKTDALAGPRAGKSSARIVPVDEERMKKAISSFAGKANMSEEQARSAISQALEQVGVLLEARGRKDDISTWQDQLLNSLASDTAYQPEAEVLGKHSFSVLVDPAEKEILGKGSFKEVARTQSVVWQRVENEITVNATWSVAGKFFGTGTTSKAIQQNELRAIRQLRSVPDHPNVARYHIFSHGADERPVCAEGHFDLGSALENGLLSEEAALDILMDEVEGSIHLIDHNVVHGDVKAGNGVLFNRLESSENSPYIAKLIDVGATTFLGEDPKERIPRELQDQTYSSPEASRAAMAHAETKGKLLARLSEQQTVQDVSAGSYIQIGDAEDAEGYNEAQDYLAKQVPENADQPQPQEQAPPIELPPSEEDDGYGAARDYLQQALPLEDEEPLIPLAYGSDIVAPSDGEDGEVRLGDSVELKDGYEPLSKQQVEEALEEVAQEPEQVEVPGYNPSAAIQGFISPKELQDCDELANTFDVLGRGGEARALRSLKTTLTSTDPKKQATGMVLDDGNAPNVAQLDAHLEAQAKLLKQLLAEHLSGEGLQSLLDNVSEVAKGFDKSGHERCEVYSLGVLAGLVSGVGIPRRSLFYAKRRDDSAAEFRVAKKAPQLPREVQDGWTDFQKQIFPVVSRMVSVEPSARGTLRDASSALQTIRNNLRQQT